MNDLVKCVIVGIIAAVGVAGQYFYSSLPTSQLLLGWVVLGSVAIVIFATTSKGQVLMAFAREAQIELRKVVWPTKKETLQTSFIVLVVVLIMGLALWLMDTTLLYIVGTITGQKG